MWRVAVCLILLTRSLSWAVETIRIHVLEHTSSAKIYGKALQWGQDEDDAHFTAIIEEHVKVSLDGNRIRLGQVAIEQESIRLRNSNGNEVGFLQLGDRLLRGDLVVRRHSGKLQFINVLPLEDYLVGVLGSEMPKSFPPQALQAQAVAARTYALVKKIQSYSSPFHLGSDVLSQVYGGLTAEDEKTRAAVEATKGQVLTFDLTPIEAYFHASCGGRTETGFDALSRNLPYLQSVDCPCGKLKEIRWSAQLEPEELKKAFGTEVTKAKKWEIAARTDSGRASSLSFFQGHRLDAKIFRERLGYRRVKSLQFEITNDSNGLKLSGTGYGHGAGLCQWGAKLMAEQGGTYEQILLHYYPGTQLQTLY